MKESLTDITIIVDRSGSMSTIAEETCNGIKVFIEDQRKVPGEAVLSLVQFDHEIERPFTAKPLAQVGEIGLVPRGYTALLDAIGATIEATGKRLKEQAEADRPGRVVVVIVTDGYENASRKYKSADIHAAITLQRDTYKWDFVFMGANQDAIATAADMNIPASNAISYAASAAGTAAMYASVSNNLRSARATRTSMASNAFTPAQRKGSMAK